MPAIAGLPPKRSPYLLATFCTNEKGKIGNVIRKFSGKDSYDFLVMDDYSTDGSEREWETAPGQFGILRNDARRGIGYSIRRVLFEAKKAGYTALFIIAGNDKDSPDDVPKLVEAMEQGYDFVQGSRFLPGGHFGNMPIYRTIATRIVHPWLFSFFSGKWVTDTTNGFRAVRLSLLDDPRLNLNQEWLQNYELEPYLYFKAIRLGYKVKEVPVTKIYPPKALGYTKMKPITGWWSILRPIVFLGLGLRK